MSSPGLSCQGPRPRYYSGRYLVSCPSSFHPFPSFRCKPAWRLRTYWKEQTSFRLGLQVSRLWPRAASAPPEGSHPLHKPAAKTERIVRENPGNGGRPRSRPPAQHLPANTPTLQPGQPCSVNRKDLWPQNNAKGVKPYPRRSSPRRLLRRRDLIRNTKKPSRPLAAKQRKGSQTIPQEKQPQKASSCCSSMG